ncbi:hypothetical protein E3N88_16977 [Mikania micrantha]|uniref:Protein kinase domain-containing protein n=1 Tax=Mikania micrantha TaxID=192012 RepID=A0A5N6NQM7_9ASTR|nr:hypothetical protein E3N88_16977 [Mikania micrantha]
MLVPISNYKPRDSSTATAGEHQNHIKGQLVAVTFTTISTDYGSLFEVSGKYVPPIRPVGTGAYGIVWSRVYCYFVRYISMDLVAIILSWISYFFKKMKKLNIFFPLTTVLQCMQRYMKKFDIKKIGNAFETKIDAKRPLREIKLLCHMKS